MLAISISGPDACKFLQGQLTCDVMALKDGEYTLGAYCNIKGKVDSLFYILNDKNAYFIYLNSDLATTTLNELKKYAIFSKVSLEICSKSLPAELIRSDKQEILAQIPQLYTATVGMFFPHDLNLPTLGAVSFTKGCYRGQEIVARMQHRGNLKRQMYFFIASQATINPGDTVTTSDNTPVGTVVRVCTDNMGPTLGLAVITDTAVTQQLKIRDNELLIQKTLDS